jgi:hypothetical protein
MDDTEKANDDEALKEALLAGLDKEFNPKAKSQIYAKPGDFQFVKSTAAPHVAELSRLNDLVRSIYAQKTQEMQDMKARHAEERVRVHNDYERRHDDLVHQAANAVRLMDDRQFMEMKPLMEFIRRLEGMLE